MKKEDSRDLVTSKDMEKARSFRKERKMKKALNKRSSDGSDLKDPEQIDVDEGNIEVEI